jgi:hypothetical protein
LPLSCLTSHRRYWLGTTITERGAALMRTNGPWYVDERYQTPPRFTYHDERVGKRPCALRLSSRWHRRAARLGALRL